jgi:hypothetical protein
VRRAVAVVGASLIAGALAVWGCAKSAPRPVQTARVERPQDRAPDGGWANYLPGKRDFTPDPGRSAAGRVAPVAPWPSSPNGVPVPAVGK